MGSHVTLADTTGGCGCVPSFGGFFFVQSWRSSSSHLVRACWVVNNWIFKKRTAMMLCQLVSILLVLPAIIRAATIKAADDDLLKIMKKNYQENHKPLVATLNASKVSDEDVEIPRG